MKIIFKNNIIDKNSFFGNCQILYSIDLSNFNTSKVKEMGFMFNQCFKLKEIKGINNLNANKVTNMNSMFYQCKELEYLDLLKEIKGINKFNTNEVINIKAMFQGCNELEYLDLSNFNTSNVNDMDYMVSDCYKLKNLKF